LRARSFSIAHFGFFRPRSANSPLQHRVAARWREL